MSKTIEQLRASAAQIEEATRQGENTQLRVGGLFQDLIDFIAQIPVTETVLGPLLQALNNSELINPGDGQTLTFSIMKENWTFSDELTQLKIAQGRINQTITSNYNSFLQIADQLQANVDATDNRVRSYKTDYDNSQLEYATWRDDTDMHLAQYAAAIDTNTGQIVSISGRVDTAFDQLDYVTNNQEAADKALGKLFNLTGLDYEDPDEAYTASWLYKNRQGIYGAAATFDEQGNILSSSTLQVTIDGIQTAVSGNKAAADAAFNKINNEVIPGLTSDIENLAEEAGESATWISQNRDRIALVAAQFDANGNLVNTSGLVTQDNYAGLFTQHMEKNGVVTEGSMSVYLKKNEFGNYLSVAEIKADQIIMKSNTLDAWIKKWNINGDYITITTGMLESIADNIKISAKNVVLETDTMNVWARQYNLSADNISFAFSDIWEVYNSGGDRVMWLDSNGNLTITGKLKEGVIDNTLSVGTLSGRHFIIGASDSNGRAFISGYDNDNINIAIGWYEGNTSPRIIMYDNPYFDLYGDGKAVTHIRPGTVQVADVNGDELNIRVNNSKILISPTNNAWWLTESESSSMASGYVYVDNNKYLRIR